MTKLDFPAQIDVLKIRRHRVQFYFQVVHLITCLWDDRHHVIQSKPVIFVNVVSIELLAGCVGIDVRIRIIRSRAKVALPIEANSCIWMVRSARRYRDMTREFWDANQSKLEKTTFLMFRSPSSAVAMSFSVLVTWKAICFLSAGVSFLPRSSARLPWWPYRVGDVSA
jgi:hypothetical protein